MYKKKFNQCKNFYVQNCLLVQKCLCAVLYHSAILTATHILVLIKPATFDFSAHCLLHFASITKIPCITFKMI